MQVTKKLLDNKTKAELTVDVPQDVLSETKRSVVRALSSQVKVQGFRNGKAPLELVEKQLEPSVLQQHFLEHVIEATYPQAVAQEKLRPVDRPDIAIVKFVPFTTLEYTATAPVLGEVTLADYKKIKKDRKTVKVTAAEVDEVIESLRSRQAEKVAVDRAAKEGDQVVIDFSGVDADKKPIKGADGTDYPLALGSNTFIPGFEPALIGLKKGEKKTFPVTFPGDYGVSTLAGAEVTFTVTVKDVFELKKPALDDAFAASVGPVKTVEELKRDIKKELTAEKQRQEDLQFESELVAEITKKSKLVVPQVLIDDQVNRMYQEQQQNVTYRGQTIKEFLESKSMTEEEYKTKELAPQAEERVKASIVLAEIADKEKIEVTPEELEIRMQVLKGQYQDQKMQSELEKPEARREIASRMLSEKTVAQLSAIATKK